MSHISSTLLRRHETVDLRFHDFATDPRHRIGHIIGRHQFGALLINDLALVVGDVVVLKQVLAGVEVVGLDLALRTLDLLR